MRDASRIELFLEGLGCAACAAKIEARVNMIENIDRVSVNYVTSILTIEAGDISRLEQIISGVKSIVSEIEPGVKVREKTEKREQHRPGAWKGELDRNGIAGLIIGVLLLAAAIAMHFPLQLTLMLYLISYLLIGGKILLAVVRNLLKGRVFDENFLMGVATIGAFAIGEYPEAVAVMLFFRIGELMQDLAVNRSRRSIAGLMDIRPEYANIRVGRDIRKVSPEVVKVGDIILVKPGERIPLDGMVVEGVSVLDTSALTGEAMPRDVEPGAEVLAGFINKNGMLTVRTAREFQESAVSKILELVENAGARKAPTEKFITKFARYYTPVVVFSAAALAFIPPLVIEGAVFSDWVYRALVFLVVSCPCALVVSIPLGFFGGIGGASKNGILMKGGNFLEALANVDTVIFDKTGTLTRGVFKVTQVNPVGGMDGQELLKYIAHAEHGSNHPVALSILESYGKDLDSQGIESYYEMPGMGVKVKMKRNEILAGNARLMEEEGIAFNPVDLAGTVVYAALDGKYIGNVVVTDVIKEDAASTINQLKALGVRRTVMLTGDSRRAALDTAKELVIDEVHFELLPHQKVTKVEMAEKSRASKGKVVFVGDGINDAPALARADIGVAMGGLGSDAAIEAADVVIMTDQPYKLVKAMKIAKRTKSIVWQNIVFALGVKGIVLLLGAGGSASMWQAVFADVGVALIAVLNSMRAMRIKV